MMHKIIKKIAPIAYVGMAKINRFPLFIQIETTGVCNLRCSMCESSLSKNKKGRLMNYKKFNKLFNDIYMSNSFILRKMFPRLLLFDLTGIGEPFMNKDFLRFVNLLKSKGVTLTFASNFTMLNDSIINELIRNKVDLIFISLDGATKESYERMRQGADFNNVIGNIKRFVELRGKGKPKLVIRFLASRVNVGDMVRLIELANGIGIKNISITRMNTSKETKHLQVDLNEFNENKNLAVIRARELGVELDFGLFYKRPIKECKRAFNSMFITCEGYVLPCCFINQGGRYEDIKRHFNFGNVFEINIKNIWRSNKYKAFRKMISKGRVPGVCRDCYLFE